MIHVLPYKSYLSCDVHSHILPGVDDGARDFEESVELLREVCEQGIDTIFVTPHYSRTGDNSRIIGLFQKYLKDLNEKSPELFARVDIKLGQELVYHSELLERLKQGQALTLDSSRYVLIEFVPATAYRDMYQQLRELANAGFIPVVAHMERYDALRKNDNIEELKDMGCLMQMNYDSISGENSISGSQRLASIFNRELNRCRKLVKDGYIDVFGSDTHRRDFRPPKIEKAAEWIRNNT